MAVSTRFSARFSAAALTSLVLLPAGCSELPPGVLASREEAIRTAAAELPPAEPERLPTIEARPLDAGASNPSFWVDMRAAADFDPPAATDQPSEPLDDLSTKEIAEEILEGRRPVSPDRGGQLGGSNGDFIDQDNGPEPDFDPPQPPRQPTEPTDFQRPGRDPAPSDDFNRRQPPREDTPRRTGVPGTVLADQVADRVSKQLSAQVIEEVGNLVITEMTDRLEEAAEQRAEERLEYQRSIDQLERELAEAEDQLEKTRERLGELERQRIELEVRLGSREEMIEMLQKLLNFQ